MKKYKRAFIVTLFFALISLLCSCGKSSKFFPNKNQRVAFSALKIGDTYRDLLDAYTDEYEVEVKDEGYATGYIEVWVEDYEYADANGRLHIELGDGEHISAIAWYGYFSKKGNADKFCYDMRDAYMNKYKDYWYKDRYFKIDDGMTAIMMSEKVHDLQQLVEMGHHDPEQRFEVYIAYISTDTFVDD